MSATEQSDIHVRRLWLPWRSRFRLILAYPRHWRWVLVQLNRFDLWFSRRIEDKPLRRVWIGLVFLPFVVVRFLGLVAVCEITIIAFAASIYLVWGEWLLLLVLFPFWFIARLIHLLPWQLAARSGRRRWLSRTTGWTASKNAIVVARDALTSHREPPGVHWTEVPRRSRMWI